MSILLITGTLGVSATLNAQTPNIQLNKKLNQKEMIQILSNKTIFATAEDKYVIVSFMPYQSLTKPSRAYESIYDTNQKNWLENNVKYTWTVNKDGKLLLYKSGALNRTAQFYRIPGNYIITRLNPATNDYIYAGFLNKKNIYFNLDAHSKTSVLENLTRYINSTLQINLNN